VLPLLALAALSPTPGVAQGLAWDASVGAAGGSGRGAAGLRWSTALGPVTLGAGPRLSYYFARERAYRNRGDVSAALPTRLLVDPSIVGLNIRVQSDLALVGPVGIGANIDLAGLAFGPRRSAGAASLRVARGSLLLLGTRDRGSLNSEFFLAVRASRRLTVNAGVSHYVTGYRAQAGGLRERYSRFDTVPFVSVSGRL
jgi:hypothetical protein